MNERNVRETIWTMVLRLQFRVKIVLLSRRWTRWLRRRVNSNVSRKSFANHTMIIDRRSKNTIRWEMNSRNVFTMVRFHLQVLREDLSDRFSLSACQKFQDFENEHAEKMLNFAVQYSDILKRNNDQIRTAQNEFSDKLKQMTVNDLVDSFVEQKRTGSERPRETRNDEFSRIFLLFLFEKKRYNSKNSTMFDRRWF